MFASDFGLSRARLARRRGAIAADADTALAVSLDAGDLDLSAELALTGPLLRAAWSAPAIFAFHVLAAVEDREGFLPVLGMDLSRYRALPAGERSGYMLAHSYHSAYVMGFLCAAALRASPMLPAAVPESAKRGAAARILRLLDGSEVESCWGGHFRALRERQQDSLAPFALAILLRRAAVRGNLALVRTALQVAVDFGIAGGTAPIHAAALLRRSQLFDAQRQRKLREPMGEAQACFDAPSFEVAAERRAPAVAAGTVAANGMGRSVCRCDTPFHTGGNRRVSADPGMQSLMRHVARARIQIVHPRTGGLR